MHPRLRSVALAAGTIVVGLVVHLRGDPLPADLRDVLGDALWAAMIFWITGIVAPSARRVLRVVAALAVCAAVEFGQLYRASWITALRATTLGHLVLGSDFDARDLAAYAAGVLAAAWLERPGRRHAARADDAAHG